MKLLKRFWKVLRIVVQIAWFLFSLPGSVGWYWDRKREFVARMGGKMPLNSLLPSSMAEWLLIFLFVVGFFVAITTIVISIKIEKRLNKPQPIMQSMKRGLMSPLLPLSTWKEWKEQNKRSRQEFAKKYIRNHPRKENDVDF